ncbi:MAG: SDR family oxidoreductase [Planctomycetota bacterium]|nr:SDR family oxidoreductase [Planctomycetota bacterium]
MSTPPTPATSPRIEPLAQARGHPHPALGPLPFAGKRPIACVTGGARRVGRAIALELAARGLDVLLTFNTSEHDARATCDAIRGLGVDAAAVAFDLADPPATLARAHQLAAALPRLDVLVHNASTYEPSPLVPVESLDLDAAARQHAVNALSPLALSAALAPLLGAAGTGAIVAMLDIHTEPAPPLPPPVAPASSRCAPRRDHAAYAMSKAALGAMVRALAVDLAPRVRVNGIAPGVIAWPESGPEADPEMQARYLSRVPLRRTGTPEDAAKAVAFLALDAAYTTGQVLAVDGGRALR